MKHITLFSLLSISLMSTNAFSMDIPDAELSGRNLRTENARLTSTPQSQSNDGLTTETPQTISNPQPSSNRESNRLMHSIMIPNLDLFWTNDESDDKNRTEE